MIGKISKILINVIIIIMFISCVSINKEVKCINYQSTQIPYCESYKINSVDKNVVLVNINKYITQNIKYIAILDCNEYSYVYLIKNKSDLIEIKNTFNNIKIIKVCN